MSETPVVTYSLTEEALLDMLDEVDKQNVNATRLVRRSEPENYAGISEEGFNLLCGFIATNYELILELQNILDADNIVEDEARPDVRHVYLLEDSITFLEKTAIARYYYVEKLNKINISIECH